MGKTLIEFVSIFRVKENQELQFFENYGKKHRLMFPLCNFRTKFVFKISTENALGSISELNKGKDCIIKCKGNLNLRGNEFCLDRKPAVNE